MNEHEKVNYLEFPASDLDATKAFFTAVFGWAFTDYGPDYTAFAQAEAGLDGGFFRSEQASKTEAGGALVVFYSRDLDATEARIRDAGGTVIRPTFSFPGGRRFHFTEPSGNEFAVWSDPAESLRPTA